jgi:hypothetical protein
MTDSGVIDAVGAYRGIKERFSDAFNGKLVAAKPEPAHTATPTPEGSDNFDDDIPF